MDYATYKREAEVEEGHWWFKGRRKLFSNIVDRDGIKRETRVLDIGTSTGTNLRMLRELKFDDVTGLDSSPIAAEFCKARNLGTVQVGDVRDLPFDDASFGLVLATDVIEHVDDHAKAVSEIARVTWPGGKILITVPAFKALWGRQDEVSHHQRRYRAKEVLDLVKIGGLEVEKSFYFNYLLFPVIWLARKLIVWFKLELESENQLNIGWTNAVLSAIFRIDVLTAPTIGPPFGVSYLVYLRRSAETDTR